MKQCVKCKESKPLAEFGRHSATSDKLRNCCRPCNNERARAWSKANPEKRRELNRTAHQRRRADPVARERDRASTRAYHATEKGRRKVLNNRLKEGYGVSLEQYEDMLVQQDGKCAICRNPPRGGNHVSHRLHVDHDHTTGRIRGLLCHQCNTGIGFLGESPDRLIAAATYVRERK